MDTSYLNYVDIKNDTILREWLADRITEFYMLARGEDVCRPISYSRNGVLIDSAYTIPTDSRIQIQTVDISYDRLVGENFDHLNLGHDYLDENWNGYFHIGRIERPYQEFTDAGIQIGDFILTDKIETHTFEPKVARIQVTPELYNRYHGIRVYYAVTTHFEE